MAPIVFCALLLALSIAVGKLILVRRSHTKQLHDVAQAIIAVGRLQTYIDKVHATVPEDDSRRHLLQAYACSLPDVLRGIAAEQVTPETLDAFCAQMAVYKWRCESAKVNLHKIADGEPGPRNGQ